MPSGPEDFVMFISFVLCRINCSLKISCCEPPIISHSLSEASLAWWCVDGTISHVIINSDKRNTLVPCMTAVYSCSLRTLDSNTSSLVSQSCTCHSHRLSNSMLSLTQLLLQQLTRTLSQC